MIWWRDGRSMASRTRTIEGGDRNLILGIVNNYTFYTISRFILSLRKTSFRGHVCLYVGPNTSIITVGLLKMLDVEVIRYDERFPFLQDTHVDSVKSLPHPIHIYNYRHFLYLDYLLKHRGEFKNVLVTDVRDVFFQKDPFDFNIDDSVHVAMENAQIRIGSCPWASRWIVAGFGEAALMSVRDKEISCAGTTLAPSAEMERYLGAMVGKIQDMADAFECADQGAHNLMLHEGTLEPTKRLYNFRGPVLTLGYERDFLLNEHGELTNEDSSVINIIHQYHPHAELVRLFERKVRPSVWRRSLAIAGHYAERLFRLVARPARAVTRRLTGMGTSLPRADVPS